MTTCDERREAELDKVTWWRYMRASDMSDNYRRVIINGLTQNFVAMDAERTSLRTAITILARLLQDFITGRGLDRVLNGPTSEVWIDPWVDYLRAEIPGQFPVCFHPEAAVRAFIFDEENNRISGLRLEHSHEPVRDKDCVYLAAIPVEAMVELLHNSPREILEHSPALKLLSDKHLQVNWMSGVMYYLRSDSRMASGHIIYLDSAWAITSISQNQFWARKVQSYGKERVQGIVSAIISDWFKSGNGGFSSRPARETDDSREVAEEALAEIRCHIKKQLGINLSKENIAGYFLDSDITFDRKLVRNITGLMPAIDFVRSLQKISKDLKHRDFLRVRQNLEPLFINTVGSWPYRPDELTDIPNLVLASDYVRTNTDLATMEGANESARRAVNRIMDLLHVTGRRCRTFEFDEPMLFSPLKTLDRYYFQLGLPHPALPPWSRP
jgi:15-cis-phytoene desaturase